MPLTTKDPHFDSDVERLRGMHDQLDAWPGHNIAPPPAKLESFIDELHARVKARAPLLRDKEIRKTIQLYMDDVIVEARRRDFLEDKTKVTNITCAGVAHSKTAACAEAFKNKKVVYRDPQTMTLKPLHEWRAIDFTDREFRYSKEDKKFYDVKPEEWAEWVKLYTPILIMHDWRAALGDAIKKLPDDEWRVPFDAAVFEFATITHYEDGTHERNHTLVFYNSDADKLDRLIILYEMKSGEYELRTIPTEGRPIFDLAKRLESYRDREEMLVGKRAYIYLDFIRAACIALDAHIAEAEEVKAPAKLQHARAKRGKLPLPDFRIINLALRYRKDYVPGTTHEPTGRKMPWHMRRGHYWPRLGNDDCKMAKFRKWRPWTMVGDPDLRHIEHQYRI